MAGENAPGSSRELTLSAEWRDHVARLTSHADSLLAVSNQIFEEKVQFERDDKSALMLLGYSSRQDGHLRAIRALVDAEHGGDATLIARTMAEGMAQLTWALDHRPDGPQLWFWYGLIEDWRQIRENERNGLPLDRESARVLGEKLKEHGPRYYKPKIEKRLEQGGALPDDPFRRQWSDLDVYSMMDGLGWSWLYDTVYRTFSDRVHWTARSLFLSVDMQNGVVNGYRPTDPHGAANALKVGFFSLWQTLRLLDWFFKLGRSGELSELHASFDVEASRILPDDCFAKG